MGQTQCCESARVPRPPKLNPKQLQYSQAKAMPACPDAGCHTSGGRYGHSGDEGGLASAC
eukprot:10189738-Alexandrium_andersonii.AAC.1